MAKKQRRRTVSLSRDYHDALKAYSEQLGIPISRIVENALGLRLREAGLLVAEKKTGVGKYWDPERKRWRVAAADRISAP